MRKLVFILLTFLLTVVYTAQSGTPKKVIMDIDPGVDDAHSLLMMLSQEKTHSIVALTITEGNTFLSNVTHNAIRLLKLCERLDIPVFIGDKLTLNGLPKKTSIYFGANGFGNIPDDPSDFSVYLTNCENASQALVRLVSESPGEITLLALGTLTNVARAMQLDEDFGKNLKECVIMGGNYLGIGNESPRAEFNFLTDPSAADLVVRNLDTNITIITWELCLNHSVEWSFYDELVSKATPKSDFMKLIGQFSRDRASANNETVYYFADQFAVAVYLVESIILKSQQIVASVETNDDNNNIGEMYVDWYSTVPNKNIKLVTEVDLDKVKNILFNSL